MKKIIFLIAVLGVLTGCAELPSASKQSFISGSTTAKPTAQELTSGSKGSLVPSSKVAVHAPQGLFEDGRAVGVVRAAARALLRDVREVHLDVEELHGRRVVGVVRVRRALADREVRRSARSLCRDRL